MGADRQRDRGAQRDAHTEYRAHVSVLLTSPADADAPASANTSLPARKGIPTLLRSVANLRKGSSLPGFDKTIDASTDPRPTGEDGCQLPRHTPRSSEKALGKAAKVHALQHGALRVARGAAEPLKLHKAVCRWRRSRTPGRPMSRGGQADASIARSDADTGAVARPRSPSWKHGHQEEEEEEGTATVPAMATVTARMMTRRSDGAEGGYRPGVVCFRQDDNFSNGCGPARHAGIPAPGRFEFLPRLSASKRLLRG